MTTTPCRVCGCASTPLRWACRTCVRDTRRRLDDLAGHARLIESAVILLPLHRYANHARAHRANCGLADCLPPGDVTVSGEAAYLRAHVEWCAHQPWGHELVNVVLQLHNAAASTSGNPHVR